MADWATSPGDFGRGLRRRLAVHGIGAARQAPLEVAQGIGPLVTQVAVHPSRPLVAAGFDDGCVAVCELATDRRCRAVRLRSGNGGRVSALAWSRDGARLAAGTELGALVIFELSKPTA